MICPICTLWFCEIDHRQSASEKERHRAYYRTHKQEHRERVQRWREKNRERYNEYQRTLMRERYKART